MESVQLLQLVRGCVTLAIAISLSLGAGAQQPAGEPIDPRIAAVSDEALRLVSEARQLVGEATQAVGDDQRKLLQQAFAKLQTAAEADENIPPARTMWAKILLNGGDQTSGFAALQQSVLEAPGDPEAFVLLANINLATERLAEAELMLEAAQRRLETWSDERPRREGLQGQIYSLRAQVAAAQSQLAARAGSESLANQLEERNRELLRRLVELDPDNAQANQRLAVALLSAGQVDASIQRLEAARRINPELPATELFLAQTYVVNNDFETAETYLQQAVQRHASDSETLTNAADLYLVLGKLDRAGDLLEKVLKANPKDLAANRLDAQRLRFMSQWETAVQRLQKLNNQNPTDFETANLLALTLTELEAGEDHRRAKELATVTAQRFGGELNTLQGRRALLTLAWTAYRADDSSTARVALGKLLSGGVQSGNISGDESYYLARLLEAFERTDVAVPLLENTVQAKAAFPKRTAATELLKKLKQ